MPTTQLPIDGIFDTETGKLVGFDAGSGTSQVFAEVPATATGIVGSDATGQLVSVSPLRITAQHARPVKLMLAGASQYSRCSTEVQVVSAQITDEVLYVTHSLPTFGFMSGTEAFCAVDRHFVSGPVTIVTDTALTIPAPGYADTTPNTSGTQFLHFLGLHAGASWVGHLQSRYDGGMKYVGNISQHGANVNAVALRMPAILAAIEKKKPDILIFEPGWGNSFNQGDLWDSVIPLALENLRQVCAVVPIVVLATLPPIAPGGTPTSVMIDNYHRMNHWLRAGDILSLFPNIVIVDSTTALQDFTRADAGSIAGVHSDSLHWTPLGARVLAESCYAPVLDRMIPVLPISRGGASHVWVNGNRQLFDGLLTATGYTPSTGGASGTLDNTMTIGRQGGAGTAVCSKVLRSNGLYTQRIAMSGMAATAVYQITVAGETGLLLKDRLQAGRTYRPVVRAAIVSVTGTIRAFSIMGAISLTGHAGTMPRTAWAGRTQEGFVEGGASVFPQATAEAARDYIGADFTVPAGTTVTGFTFEFIVRAGAASSGMTLDIEDITFLDVTGTAGT